MCEAGPICHSEETSSNEPTQQHRKGLRFSDAAGLGIHLEVVKLQQAKRGSVLLPKRWGVERSNAWMACFCCLERDYERLLETLAGLYFLAFAIVMLARFITFITQSA